MCGVAFHCQGEMWRDPRTEDWWRQCRPVRGIFPPGGGAVDVRMCWDGSREGERRDCNWDFEAKSERIRERGGYGGTGKDTSRRTPHFIIHPLTPLPFTLIHTAATHTGLLCTHHIWMKVFMKALYVDASMKNIWHACMTGQLDRLTQTDKQRDKQT